ncbi:hypothetical protein Tco_0004213 [Tanacetum coccineum]
MMLPARAITQHFLTPINICLRTSSNTRNQAVIQDGRVDIQSKNVGYAGNASRNSRRIVGNQGNNARNGFVKRNARNADNMLLATKDEDGIHLDKEENDFMLMIASRVELLEELIASVIMMAHIQHTDNDSDVETTYDSDFLSNVNGRQVKHAHDAHDQRFDDFESLIKNVQVEAENQCMVNKEMKRKNALITKELDTQTIRLWTNIIQEDFSKEVQGMLNVFESMETEVDKTSKKHEILQNDFDRLLEATLATKVRNCIVHYVEQIENEKLRDEIEKISNDSKDNQDLLMIISKIKAMLKAVEKGKNMDTKFDKSSVLGKLVAMSGYHFISGFNINRPELASKSVLYFMRSQFPLDTKAWYPVSTASTSVSTGSRVSTVSISLDLSRLATTLNRLERSIQIGINKWYQSLLRNSE